MFNDAAYWRNARAGYLTAARECRAVLTDPKGFWRYSPADPRVREAVRKWVARAKKAHAFTLGREPVVKNFVFIGQQGAYQGPAYAAGAMS